MSTLFTAVSVEQQETVAGGLAIDFENLNRYTKKVFSGYNQRTDSSGSESTVVNESSTDGFASFRVTGLNPTNLQ